MMRVMTIDECNKFLGKVIMKKRSEERMDFSEQMARGEEFQSTTIALPSGVSRFKLDGTKSKRIDIIPYIVGEGNPDADPGQKYISRTFYQHRGIGPDNRAYICLWETYKKRCPICEERNRLRNEDPDDEMAKKLKPSKRQLWNVIDVDNPDAGIQIWDVSHFYFGEQLFVAVQSSDEDEGHKYFADPETGFTLKLTVEQGSSGGKNDLKISRVDFRPRKKQYGKSIIKEAVCLDELLKPLSYKELKKVFLQSSDEEEDDDSGSSSSSKKGKKMKRKQNAKKMGIEKGSTVVHPELGECIVTAVAKDGFSVTLKDEDDDVHKGVDVAILEVEGAEEDEAPKKRGRGRPKGSTSKKKAKDEDEDEDDEEEEDSDDDDDEDSDDEDEDESDDEEEEDDEDSDDEDDDDEESDDDEEEDDEEEEEEEPAPKKKGAAKGKAKGKRK